MNLFKQFDGWAWYALFLAFALTTSTALLSVLAFGVLIWAASHHREWWLAIQAQRRNPIVIAMLTFTAILALGAGIALAHGYSPWHILGKHVKFVAFFILLGMLTQGQRHDAAFIGFGIGMALSMLLSILSPLLGIKIGDAVPGGELSPFLNHTEHNIFLSLAAFGLATLLVTKRIEGIGRWVGWILIALAFIDILLLVRGRTGQIMFLILAAFFILFTLRTRAQKLLAATVFLAGLGMVIAYGHSALNQGVDAAKQDIGDYHAGQTDTSVGLRAQFAKSAMPFILDQYPLIGNGTGAFKDAYTVFYKTHPTLQPPFPNPHNDYLYFWAENGLPGVLALFSIYLTMFLAAWKRRGRDGACLAALALCWSISSAANSFMLDHTTGYAFVILLAAILAGWQRKSGSWHV